MRFIVVLVVICLLLADLPVCRAQASAADEKSPADPAGNAVQSGTRSATGQKGDSITINVKLDTVVVASPKPDATLTRHDHQHLNRKPRHRTAIIIACTVGTIVLFFLLTSRIQNPLDGIGNPFP